MTETAPLYRLGVDVGGTFTDFALFDESGSEIAVLKRLTTPADPLIAVIEGTAALPQRTGGGAVQRGDRFMSTHPIDAVSRSIMWDRLVGITDEIVTALVRSSFSTILHESEDLSVVVLDAQGSSIARGNYSGPSFTGTASPTLRHILAKLPPDSLDPGDSPNSA